MTDLEQPLPPRPLVGILAERAEALANMRRPRLTDNGDPVCETCGAATQRDGMHACPNCDGSAPPRPLPMPKVDPAPTPVAEPQPELQLGPLAKRIQEGRR